MVPIYDISAFRLILVKILRSHPKRTERSTVRPTCKISPKNATGSFNDYSCPSLPLPCPALPSFLLRSYRTSTWLCIALAALPSRWCLSSLLSYLHRTSALLSLFPRSSLAPPSFFLRSSPALTHFHLVVHALFTQEQQSEERGGRIRSTRGKYFAGNKTMYCVVVCFGRRKTTN